MGTHPIFESDFDCLTDTMALYYAGRIAVPSTSKQSLHDRFTSFMKNRPSKLDVVATPAKASDRNQRLAAEMESRESVKSAIHQEERKWSRHHPYGHYQPYQHQRGGGKDKNKGKGKKNSKNQKKTQESKDSEEKGRKAKQPKVVPDQNELDAELEAYNKGREKKVKENLEESADPLTESKDDDILKDSKPTESSEPEKAAV